jgi:uncharacterized hydrophobic protein (TIGR00271 family)
VTATSQLEDGQPGIRSRRLNSAALKGVILVILGVAILAAPDRTTTALRWIFGLALVANMAVDLYVAVRHPRDRWRLVFAGTASGLVGMSFLLFPEVALRVVAGGVALIVAIYGLQLATKAFRGDRDTAGRAWSLGSGIVAIALAVVLAVLPEAVILTLLLAAAVSSIVYGALAIIIGLEADGATDVDLLDLTDVIRRWLNERDVGDDRRAAVSEGLDFEPPEAVNKRVSYSLMLGLSVIIATLAVLQDSTAVIIGAMLIAPLMTPIMAMAAGVVGGWRDRVGSAAAILVLSVAASIGLAWIVAEWVPALVPLGVNSQVQGRIQPTVVDLLIALAAGAAGAYATVDKRVSSSIAGVAIAVALVPPLSIVGVTLHGRQYDWAAGAMLLFTTNFVAIFIAGVVVFALVGFVPFRTFYEKRRNVRAVVASVATAALIILIPLTFSAQGILTSSNQDSMALEVTIEWVADTDLEAVSATVVDRTVTVEVEGTGEIPGASDLQRELADALDMDVEVRIEYAPIAVVTYSIDRGEEVQVPNMIVSP